MVNRFAKYRAPTGPDFSAAAAAPDDPAVMAAYERQQSDPFQSGGDDPGVVAAYERANRQPMSMGDVAGGAVSNFGPSAAQFGSDLLGVVTDPVGTIGNVIKTGTGVVEKFIPGEQSHEPYADAVGQFFADRYGGIENVKRTMATDPVGFLADLSMLLSGGSTVAARAPGVAGTVSRAVGTAGRVIDPINATLKAAGAVGKGAGKAASVVSGLTTGTGASAIQTAARAGFEGGEAGRTFRANMRGTVPMEDVISKAKTGLDAIRNQRQAAYRSGMADLSKDQTVLDFSAIDRALNTTRPVKEFKGISLEPSAKETAGEIAEVLDEWRKLDPAEYHTPEGFDALKQRLGDIQKNAKPGSASEKIATQTYNIVKDQITKQAPTYARTMSDYQKASELIREIEGTLSLNRKARVDTQLRKLQSVLRNNAFTNYGKRVDLVKLLEENGADNLIAALAGQSVNTLEPRGLARIVAGVGGVGGAAAAALDPSLLVPLAIGAAGSSPRIAGEVAHAGGRFAKYASKVPLKAPLTVGYQSERTRRERTHP